MKTNKKIVNPRAPKQKRSSETRRKIFEATLAILDEVGVDGLSTNKVAEYSGVSITSVYHQFADKHAILVEMYEEWLHAELVAMDDFAEHALNNLNWQAFFSKLGQVGKIQWMDANQEKLLWTAADAIPQLHSFKSEYKKSVARRLVEYLKFYGAAGDKNRLRSIAILINELHELELFPPFDLTNKGAQEFTSVIRELQGQLLRASGLKSN